MSTYYILNYIGAAALFLYNFLCIKKRQELTQSRLRKMMAESIMVKSCLVIETLLISVFQYAPILVLNKSIGYVFGTGANYFGLLYLAPVFLILGCLILGTDWMNQIDLITPAYPLALFFSKIGCYFAGCCSGIKGFPIQLLEALVALLIFLFFLKYGKKLKTGTAYPVYVLLYSASRFFTEFLRIEEPIFIGLRIYQILCLVGLIIGAMEYYLVITDNQNKN